MTIMAGEIAEKYISGVLDGSIVAPQTIKKMCQRHKSDLINGSKRGLKFIPKRGQTAIDFFKFLHHWKGHSGPFVLEPWQQAITYILFGWMFADSGLRRFRTALVSVARKQGKTTWAAGIALYCLLCDREPGATVYAVATKRDQARECWDTAAKMVAKSPQLRTVLKKQRDNLSSVVLSARFEPLASDSDSMDGLNPSCIIADEVHAWSNRKLWDVLVTSQGARKQPLLLAISTAGYDKNSVLYQQYTYSKQVLDGVLDNDRWFAAIFELDENDSYSDPDVWVKACPNLGVTTDPDELSNACDKAKSNPAELNSFLRLRLNQWTDQSSAWLPMDAWDACNTPVDLSALAHEPCYAGLDLSTCDDITALVLLFPPSPTRPKWEIVPYFFLPEDNLASKALKDRVPYDVWVRNGLLSLTPGNVIDYSFIRAKVDYLAHEYDVREIAYDPYNATQLVSELQADGHKTVPFKQSDIAMTTPLRRIMELTLSGELAHAGNPILRWMASNASVSVGATGLIRLIKGETGRHGKIDGIAALANAMGRAMLAPTVSYFEPMFL